MKERNNEKSTFEFFTLLFFEYVKNEKLKKLIFHFSFLHFLFWLLAVQSWARTPRLDFWLWPRLESGGVGLTLAGWPGCLAWLATLGWLTGWQAGLAWHGCGARPCLASLSLHCLVSKGLQSFLPDYKGFLEYFLKILNAVLWVYFIF